MVKIFLYCRILFSRVTDKKKGACRVFSCTCVALDVPSDRKKTARTCEISLHALPAGATCGYHMVANVIAGLCR